MLPAFITCNDHIHIIPFIHDIDHLRKLFRLMLKVIIHRYDELPFCMGKSAQKCRMLAEILAIW